MSTNTPTYPVRARRLLVTAVILTAATLLSALAARPAAAQDAFGFNTLRVNGMPAQGQRPLLTTLVDFDDAVMPHTRAYYDYLFYGVGSPETGVPARSVREYFRANSHDLFTWSRAGLLGPYRHPNDPRTTANERLKPCVIDPDNCAGVGVVNFAASTNKHVLSVPEGGGSSTSRVTATSENAGGAYEGFTLVDRNGGNLVKDDPVNLVAYSGHYVSAENGGSGGLVVRTGLPGAFEGFRLAKVGGSAGDLIRSGDKVALQVHNLSWVSAENGGGGRVTADRPRIGPWETFTFKEVPQDDARQLRTAMQLAAQNGHDFGRHDAAGDGDGLVERHELVFARVLSHSSPWGATRGLPAPIRVSGTSARVQPATVTFDAYPGWRRWLMS